MFQSNAFQNDAFQMTYIVIAVACIHASAIIAYPYIIKASIRFAIGTAELFPEERNNSIKFATATASIKQAISGAELC